MTLFELVFGLSAIILGLALTQIVSSLHRLLLAGRRVLWAPETMLLCTLIFLVTVSVWVEEWSYRQEISITIGMEMLSVLKLLALFLSAAFVLPEHVPHEGKIDLIAHYNRTRFFTFGALTLSLLLFRAYDALLASGDKSSFVWWLPIFLSSWPILAFFVLSLVRVRWFNILVLALLTISYAWKIIPMRLA